eukprot:TRINITY_DN103186_c0_g1_i1.p1 TRINITY_DN103186_c0_g1~~TRINITY_DN103186_c0_g1_i1.p1  ORF type:complete len:698 (+),score=105.29 TRINITY_DN103186_c0_g1_i1:331-2424(+)
MVAPTIGPRRNRAEMTKSSSILCQQPGLSDRSAPLEAESPSARRPLPALDALSPGSGNAARAGQERLKTGVNRPSMHIVKQAARRSKLVAVTAHSCKSLPATSPSSEAFPKQSGLARSQRSGRRSETVPLTLDTEAFDTSVPPPLPDLPASWSSASVQARLLPVLVSRFEHAAPKLPPLPKSLPITVASRSQPPAAVPAACRHVTRHGSQADLLQLLAQMLRDVADLHDRARLCFHELDAPVTQPAMRARGVVLNSFSLADLQANYLLSQMALPAVRTSRVSGGYRAMLTAALGEGWERNQWSGDVCADESCAERSAAAVAVEALKRDPAFETYSFRLALDFACMDVTKGEEVTLIIRDVNGWAFCHCNAENREMQSGWIPASYVAEVAEVIADHVADGALCLCTGSTVEVLRRHYAGWTLCREWSGVPNANAVREEGWVADGFLEDQCTAAIKASRRSWLLGQALQVLLAGCDEIRRKASVPNLLPGDAADMLHRTTQISLEFDKLERAASFHQSCKLKEGTVATVAADFDSSAPLSLNLKQGSQVLVEHVSDTGWVWCKANDEQNEEGWIPHHFLDGQTVDTEDHIGLCSICLEPLLADDDIQALPCAHSFHCGCVGCWLALKAQCPLCRSPAGLLAESHGAGGSSPGSNQASTTSEGWFRRISMAATTGSRNGWSFGFLGWRRQSYRHLSSFHT